MSPFLALLSVMAGSGMRRAATRPGSCYHSALRVGATFEVLIKKVLAALSSGELNVRAKTN